MVQCEMLSYGIFLEVQSMMMKFLFRLNHYLFVNQSVTFLLFIKVFFFFLFYKRVTGFQIPHLRPAEYKRSRLSRNQRTVNRAYGGVLSGSAVRERSVIIT